MEKRRKRIKKLFFSGVMFILGIVFLSIDNVDTIHQNHSKKIALDKFFENEESTINTEVTSLNNIPNYIAVLDIPSISLNQGLVSIQDKDNDISKNIMILPTSTMPNEKTGILILAAHSGNSKISFFKNIKDLKLNETIYIFYQNKKYIFSIKAIEYVPKKGYIEVNNREDKFHLILTTCNEKNKNLQLVITSDLIDIDDNY